MKWINKHYYWVIAVVLFLLMAVRGGAANTLSSLHLIPVTEALEISRAQYSLAGSAYAVASMLTTLVSGVLMMRFGYRPLLTVFMLLGAGSYLLMARADSYLLFFAGYTALGAANGICGEAGVTRTVSAWFHKHRGAMLGIVSSATGLGGSVMSVLQTAAIERDSYRASFLLVATLMTACAVLALLFVRSHPAKMGLLPYGDGEYIPYKKREHEEDHWHGLSMKQLVLRPTFYMMLFGTFLSCVCIYVAFHVVSPHLQDRGLSATQAGGLQGVLLLCLAGAKILAGYLCDAFGARKVTLLCMGLNVAALLLLATATGMALSALTIVIFALALPITTITVPLCASSLFGYQAQGEYTGIFISMVSAASIVASPVSNAVYDRIGSYSPVFIAAAGLTTLLMGAYLLMYRLADRDRKNMEAAETTGGAVH